MKDRKEEHVNMIMLITSAVAEAKNTAVVLRTGLHKFGEGFSDHKIARKTL